MVASEYVPDRGDLIWIEFSPHAGHEQAGRRPALVLSTFSYNRVRGLALMCPITSRHGDFPFEVEVISDCDIAGVVMSDQVKSTDWRARYARFVGKASPSVVNEVVKHATSLLGNHNL